MENRVVAVFKKMFQTQAHHILKPHVTYFSVLVHDI